MPSKSTPAARVMAALRRENAGPPPFAVYEVFAPQSTGERILRERGMCVVKRVRSYYVTYDGADIQSCQYRDSKGTRLVRTRIETPEGSLSLLQQPAFNTSWTHEHLFKSPRDYKPLLYLLEHARVYERHGYVQSVIDSLGGDFLVRDNLPLEPMQQFISGVAMSVTDFAYEWHDNRDLLLQLYRAAARVNEQCCEVVARSPAQTVNYGGNVIPELIGPQVFQEYYLPHYQSACGRLQAAGKLVGCHFDGNNAPIMALIGQTPLDYVEAYDPGISPGVGEALRHFAGKALWLNWPSPWHVHTTKQMVGDTVGLLKEAGGYPGLVVGVTEDLPEQKREAAFMAIMDGISEYDRQCGKRG